MKKVLIISFIFLIVLIILIVACNNEPKYTAEEWKQKQTQESKKIEETLTHSTISENQKRIDFFNKKLSEFTNFLAYYKDKILPYEEQISELTGKLQVANNPETVNSLHKKVAELYSEENKTIDCIVDYPDFLKNFIYNELKRTEKKANLYLVLSYLPKDSSGTLNIDKESTDQLLKEMEEVDNIEKKSINEMKTIKVDLNNEARELGLKVPFPND